MEEFIYGIEALKVYRDNLIKFMNFFRWKSTLGCLRNMVSLRISPKVDICRKQKKIQNWIKLSLKEIICKPKITV